jgi:hypothetical protein
MGIGYGTSMTDTDEVIWAAGTSTSDSATYDVYSAYAGTPTQDTTNIYTTTMEVNGNYIDFTSVRPLDSTASQSFIITLDKEIPMIWAFGSYTSASGYSGVAYHSTNYSGSNAFDMTVNSDGTVTSTGYNGSDVIITTPSLLITVSNGSSLSSNYTPSSSVTGYGVAGSDTVTYTVNVLLNTWLGIGYGTSMTNTDEVIFAAGADVASSTVYDVYSTT